MSFSASNAYPQVWKLKKYVTTKPTGVIEYCISVNQEVHPFQTLYYCGNIMTITQS